MWWCRQFLTERTDVGALSVLDRHAMSARNRHVGDMSATYLAKNNSYDEEEEDGVDDNVGDNDRINSLLIRKVKYSGSRLLGIIAINYSYN